MDDIWCMEKDEVQKKKRKLAAKFMRKAGYAAWSPGWVLTTPVMPPLPTGSGSIAYVIFPSGYCHADSTCAVSSVSVPSPSGSLGGNSAPFRPLFNDYGPPSMGYIQTMKPPGSQASQSTYSDLLSVIEEMGKEIRPTYAGSKSAMERLKRGIIHARALVRECLAETERNART